MRFLYLLTVALLPTALFSQSVFPLNDLLLNDKSSFSAPPKNWQIAGDAQADLSKDNTLKTMPGTGVLVNMPDKNNNGNLLLNLEHGDIDLELDVMMARHSNSGIYLQGRYEIQLLDSWGKQSASFADIGGVYERWNDAKPDGQKGYGGIPPRFNAARAPGLWQRLRIEFQAPRFDASGKKTTNAHLIRVTLNGAVIHENVELSGPTRGQAFPGEAPLGPILIQGDHGPVAFRNIRYRLYNETPAALTKLSYRTFSGEFPSIPDFSKLKPETSGELKALTWEVVNGNNDFAIQYKGTLNIPKDGTYRFELTSFANGTFTIDNDTLLKPGWWTRDASRNLTAGDHAVEIAYAKSVDWLQPALALRVEGLGFRPTDLHTPSSLVVGSPTAPILLEPGSEPELLRSFIDLPSKRRITHPISVGFPKGTHYTYDLDRGNLVQIWKGPFLDCTPMWNDRGDGHAEPRGAVLLLGDFAPFGSADTFDVQAGYHFSGYRIDADGAPIYSYTVHGAMVDDHLQLQENGKYLKRSLDVKNAAKPMAFRLARASKLQQLDDNTWAVNDRAYYLRLPDKNKATIRTVSGLQELVVEMGNGAFVYDIVW